MGHGRLTIARFFPPDSGPGLAAWLKTLSHFMPQRTLLLVDDEPGVRECLRRLLQRAGWGVITAAGPVEALQALEFVRPDAIILDVRMPDHSGMVCSGLDLLTLLRRGSAHRSVPVILLTGYFLTEEEDERVARQGATVIYKPVELPAIAGALGRLTRGTAPAAPGAA
jgi:CheY-like chemotaxis protein